jgi:hypothetical protein
MVAKPTLLLSGAGTQKSLGACQNPGDVGFDAICSLFLPKLIRVDLYLLNKIL